MEDNLTKREETIMDEDFMTERVYHALGELEPPNGIHNKLKENCINAIKRMKNE